MFRRTMSVVTVLLFPLFFGCSYSLKDDAPSNVSSLPTEFPTTFLDHKGKTVDLKQYLGKSVVLVVVRGMPESGGKFCPYCLAQANSMSKNLAEFQSRNTEVVLIVPGTKQIAESFAQQAKLSSTDSLAVPFPLIIDENVVVVNQLGIKGDLAKPSTFILNPEGKVIYAYVGKSTSDRPSVKAILKEIDRNKK